MANTRRGSARRAKPNLSWAETYRMAGKAGNAIELQATVRVYGCRKGMAVADRLVSGLLDDLSAALVKHGFSKRIGNTFIDTGSRPPEELESRAQRGDGDMPQHTDHNVQERKGKELGDQE